MVNFGKNILYRNNGNGTFTDATDRSGVGDTQWGSSAAFFDLENDGDLDLYLVNYLEYGLENPKRCGDEKHRAYCHPSHFPGARDVLYPNNGDGTFTDITRIAGVDGLKGKGLGIGLWDFDDDGFLDVYIANDTEMYLFYHNKGDGSFRDISLQSGAAFDENGVAEAGMGVTIGDYDRDGRADIFVTNFSGETNTLYRQEKPLFFRDVTHEAVSPSRRCPTSVSGHVFSTTMPTATCTCSSPTYIFSITLTPTAIRLLMPSPISCLKIAAVYL